MCVKFSRSHFLSIYVICYTITQDIFWDDALIVEGGQGGSSSSSGSGGGGSGSGSSSAAGGAPLSGGGDGGGGFEGGEGAVGVEWELEALGPLMGGGAEGIVPLDSTGP